MPRRSGQYKPVRAIGPRSRPGSGLPGANGKNDLANDFEALSIASLTSDIPIANAPKARPAPPQPFRFLDLPYELRLEVYNYHFANTGKVLDLDPANHKRIHQKLAVLRTCRTIYQEASRFFYSTHTVRIFPTQPGRFFKTKKPLLARLKPGQRRELASLELRLGPGWSKPPPGWVVKPELGLSDCTNVRKLTVFVECDPGGETFRGYRQPNSFFESFAKTLLGNVLDEIPWLGHVEVDAWSSVKKSGALIRGLLELVASRNLQVTWGPERGWTDAEEMESRPGLNLNAPLSFVANGRQKFTPDRDAYIGLSF